MSVPQSSETARVDDGEDDCPQKMIPDSAGPQLSANSRAKTLVKAGRLDLLQEATQRREWGDAEVAAMFVKAGKTGRVTVGKWLMRAFPRLQADAQTIGKALRAATKSGCSKFVRWVTTEGGRPDLRSAVSAFEDACLNGDLDLVVFLCDAFSLKSSETEPELVGALEFALEDAIEGNQVHVVEWLIDALGLEFPDSLVMHTLVMFCYFDDPAEGDRRSLRGAEAVAAKLRIPNAPLMGCIYDQCQLVKDFDFVCAGGSLESSKWLAEKFQITAELLRTHKSRAFEKALESEDARIAGWLRERFGDIWEMTSECSDDAGGGDGIAIDWLCPHLGPTS